MNPYAARPPRRGFLLALAASILLHAATVAFSPERLGHERPALATPTPIEVRLTQAPKPAVVAPAMRPVAIMAPRGPSQRSATAPVATPDPAAPGTGNAPATVQPAAPAPNSSSDATATAQPAAPALNSLGEAPATAQPAAPAPNFPNEAAPPLQTASGPPAAETAAVTGSASAKADAPAGSIRFPRSGRVEYALSIGSPPTPVGRATYAWEASERAYRLSLTAQTTGLVGLFRRLRIEQVSQGRITPDGLRPDDFQLDRGPNARNEFARFDWNAGRLTYGYPDAQQTGELTPGAQDVLSLILQFAFVPIVDGQRDVLLTTGRRLYVQSYRLVAEDLIETPSGAFRAWHLQRVRSGDGADGYDMWLATDRPFLPIRIRWTDRNGRVTDATADTIRLAQD